MTLPLLIFSSIFLLLVYKLIYPRLRYNLPPGPYPWPIIGNLHKLNSGTFPAHAELSKIYGPIISVWFGSNLTVVVSNSESAKQVLKDNDLQLANRHRTKLTSMVSKNGKDLIWADYGPHYVKLRKICTLELFSPKSIENLRPIRDDEVRSMIQSIFKDSNNNSNDCRNKGLVLREYLGDVAFNHITRLVFGKRFESKNGLRDDQGLELKYIIGNEAKISMLELVSWLKWVLQFRNDDNFSKHLARNDRLSQAIIEEHKLRNRFKSDNMVNVENKQHFVDALLSLKEKYDLDDDVITSLLWDMMTAGMDTVAITVEWAMAELIKNPMVQRKARDELDRVIGSTRVMMESDIADLPYLQCIVKESLRLHPPTPLMLPHRANSDVKIGGYDIPKGTVVQVDVWAIARDATVWQDPLEFKPERFLMNEYINIDMKGHDFRMLPFGAGRRMCPGAQLATNLVTSMIGHLLHHFEWKQPDGVRLEEIELSENPGLVTYMRTPVQAVPIIRLPPHLYGST